LEFLNKNTKVLNETEPTTKEEEKEISDRIKIIEDLKIQ